MNIAATLLNAEQLAGSVVELAGYLVLDQIDHQHKWCIADHFPFADDEVMYIDRPEIIPDTILKKYEKDLLYYLIGSIGVRHEEDNEDVQFTLQGLVRLRGVLQQSVIADVEEIIFEFPIGLNRPFDQSNRYMNVIYVKRDLSFADIPTAQWGIVTVDELVRDPNQWLGSKIALQGFLKAVDKPSEIIFMVTHGEMTTGYRDTKQAVFINRTGLIGSRNILAPRYGGFARYFADAQLVGQVSKSENTKFVIGLDHVESLAIREDDHVIRVWYFG